MARRAVRDELAEIVSATRKRRLARAPSALSSRSTPRATILKRPTAGGANANDQSAVVPPPSSSDVA